MCTEEELRIQLPAFASVHTTAMLYGNFQTDIGVCQRLYKER